MLNGLALVDQCEFVQFDESSNRVAGAGALKCFLRQREELGFYHCELPFSVIGLFELRNQLQQGLKGIVVRELLNSQQQGFSL